MINTVPHFNSIIFFFKHKKLKFVKNFKEENWMYSLQLVVAD